ncbi:hypothetical protein GF362_07265 [Candidatus Dojkabacteria bacterium]|nr:hypothetical protein [Candidatus Dojkabacteria bacterium]
MVSLHKVLRYLFVSKVRIKCLKYFFLNQDVPIHLRGMARELNEEINAVRRELMRLDEIKLLKSTKRGNKKYFSLNFDFPYFEEFCSLFIKSDGLGEDIIKKHNKLGAIYFAALTSAFVSGVNINHKEIDLIIIGDIDLELLGEIVRKEEEKIGREINYTVLKLAEFNLRKKRKDPFITNLLLSTKVLLIGNREEYVS